MDARRSVKASCSQCGGPLASATGACKRCGAMASEAGDPQYGLVDLGGTGDAGDAIALDTTVERPVQRRAPRTRAASQNVSAPVPTRARPDGAARPASSARNAAVNPAQRSSASSAHHSAVNPAQRSNASSTRQPAVTPAQRSGVSSTRNPAVTAGAARTAAANASPPDLPDLEDPAAMPYGRGMMLGDDPFNQAFNGNNAEKIELEETEPTAEPEPEAPPEPVETPEQQRARQISELASYGPEPKNIVHEPGYWLKVMLRKRTLETELLTLAAQRKRADDGTNDALCAMGQALAAIADDDRLAKLRKQLAAVSEADTRIGTLEAAGEKKKQDVGQELARLDRDLARLEQKAAPARAREAALVAEIDKIEAGLKRAELLRRKAETELEALQRKGGGDVETWGALKAEHDSRLGEVQSLGIQLRPLQDDLAVARKELAQQLRAIGVVQTEKQAAASALERAQQNHRVTSGSARGALQQALVSVANTAFKLGLEPLVAAQAMAVIEARDRAQQKRASEELLRAATMSYNHAAFQRGMTILLGGSALFLLSLVIAILF
jgi:hypothetical protein